MNFPKINSILPDESEYTSLLQYIAIPPKTLYFRGKLPDKRVKSVAIVGTRRPTAYGKEVTAKLARDLAGRGIVIVSGLALGIDAIAHTAALEAGGTTIAVLAGGVDDISPRTNTRLGERIIAQGGAVLSEYAPGEAPYASRFLERNRIVSGLSDVIIVTEAATHSGTMSTVGHALEQGRDVFAVPGPITSPMSAGCNALIRSGAPIITDVSDIMNVLAPESATGRTMNPLDFAQNDAENEVIALLMSGIRAGDELLSRSKLPASLYGQTMTLLEIRGVIKPLGANNWMLA